MQANLKDANLFDSVVPRAFSAKCGKLLLLLSLGFALSLVACSTQKPAGKSSSHSHHESSANLELNDGKKWVVVQPMMVHIRTLEKSVQNFEATPERDHAALALTIQEDLGRLVTNCTMEGKAHDELHKWLLPFLGLSAEYAKATEPGLQQTKFQEIRHSLEVFNSYFQ